METNSNFDGSSADARLGKARRALIRTSDQFRSFKWPGRDR
jgi:hypothetical protein